MLNYLSKKYRPTSILKTLTNAFKVKQRLLLFVLVLQNTFVYADELSSIDLQLNHYSQFHPLLLAKNTHISSEEAINIAKQGGKSKVLKISKKNQGGREFYRIKLITQKGLVRVIKVDAASGQRIQGKD